MKYNPLFVVFFGSLILFQISLSSSSVSRTKSKGLLGTKYIIPQSIPVTERKVNSSSSDCECAGGSVHPFDYEVIPVSSQGAGCIGGCGGSPFEVHEYSSSVKTLKVWTGGDHNGFRAMLVSFFNGKTYIIGQVPSSGPTASITFAQGESIVGLIEMCGNGVGSRIGRLSFTTSAGQQFSVGDEHTPYYFDSQDSYLTGFLGMADTEVFHLGLFMLKKVKAVKLSNVNFPSLNNYTNGLAPQQYSSTLCNDDPTEPQVQSATFTKEVGTKWSFNLTISLQFGGDVKVSAGLPIIAKVDADFHWEVGITATYSREEDTTDTKTLTFPVTVGPRSKVKASFGWWDSSCDVPYSADMVYNFQDGTTSTFHIQDSYSGAYITDVDGSYHSTPLAPGEVCPPSGHHSASSSSVLTKQ